MKSNTLAISISDVCNKNCPYCVSKMTNKVSPNMELFYKNLLKARSVASSSGITSVIITGKGEPILEKNFHILYRVLEIFQDFPIEVQTNGIEIFKDPYLIAELARHNVNTIAISIDDIKSLTIESIKDYDYFLNIVKSTGINIRYTINLHKSWEGITFDEVLNMIKFQGVADQFSFRNISYPKNSNDLEVKDWIIENKCSEIYNKMIENFRFCDSLCGRDYKEVRKLSYGATLYDVDGLGFTYFDFCIQEESEEDNIRSLIYQLDGHLYTSWESTPASRIF